MERGSPHPSSFTASFVAMARAVFARAPDAYVSTRDAQAEALISPRMATIARGISTVWRLGRAGREILRLGTFGIFEHIALRSSAIDAAIADAVADGTARIVIVGAGLDTRAFRLPVLASVEVVEIDRPPMQAYKQKRARGIVSLARAHRFVAADLTCDRLADLLPPSASAGSTLWLMEGVTMYLTRAALSATVADIASLSAPGDRLVLSYAPRGSVSKDASGAFMSRVVKRFKEPFVGLIDSGELHAILGEHGFSIHSDEGSAEWTARLTPAVAGSPPRPGERIGIARYGNS